MSDIFFELLEQLTPVLRAGAIVTPADHTWVEDRLPWIRPGDDLPTYGQKRQTHAA